MAKRMELYRLKTLVRRISPYVRDEALTATFPSPRRSRSSASSLVSPWSGGRSDAGGVFGRSFVNAGLMMSFIALPLVFGATREGLQQVPAHVRAELWVATELVWDSEEDEDW